VAENRAIYVTNLPRDATFEEIAEEFGRAGGIIDIGVDEKPRIKMYTDDNGEFNGEALIVYFKADSVDLAILKMDDYSFRPGDFNNGHIRVQAAEMNYKKNTDKEKIAKKMDRKDRKAAERTRAELNR
jgi:HIV Tat-specific factor 1